MVGGSVDKGCRKLSENIWFVWSKRSYSGQKVGCHAHTRRHGQTECEDRARILETEFTITKHGKHQESHSQTPQTKQMLVFAEMGKGGAARQIYCLSLVSEGCLRHGCSL